MKIARTCGWVLGLFALSSVASAQNANSKIGFINIQKVFESTEEGKALLKKLQDEHSAKQKELDSRMKAFEEKAKQFQAQSAMLKDDVRNERLQGLAKEERDLQALFMSYQGDINKKKGEALGKFEQKVMGVVDTISKAESLDYIFRQEVLLHAPDKMDLTAQVIREYDKRYPYQGGASAKPAAAPAKKK